MSEKMNKDGEMVVVETSTTPTTITNQFDIVDVDAAAAFMENYQELVTRLLDESDYQVINGKKAKKKSAWRKLATAFNISDEIIHHEETRDEDGQIISAKFIVKATMPNGRSSVAIGECSIYDKIRYHGTAKNPADKETPSKFVLRGRFTNVEHDIPATAHTRAKSRAIGDLIGSGENSAEEFGDDIPSESKKSKKTRKRRKVAAKEPIIETEAEVVEAEVVKNEEPEEETKEEPKQKKPIKQLKEENETIATAIETLQSNKTKVTRETIVTEILKMYEDNEATLDEYRTAKKELVE